MHVLFVSHYAPPYEGGIQVVVGQLANRLVARGHTVTLLASDIGRGDRGWLDPRVTVMPIPAWNGLERHSIPYPVFQPFALVRALGDLLGRVDVVHGHGLLYMNVVFAAALARRRGVRFVLTEHVGFVDYAHPLINAAERLALYTIGRFTLARADTIAVLNARVHAEMTAIAPRGARIVRLPNGVDTAFFRPPIPDERESLRARWNFTRPTALFVGRNSQKKGIGLVLDAAARCPEFALALVGKDTETNTPRGGHVHRIGSVDPATLATLYRAADALVLPSTGEGFPLVVAEALASGLPVIVSDEPAYREYLDARVALFVPRTGDGVADALQRVLGDAELRARMSADARAHALARFDWDRTVDGYVGAYGATLLSVSDTQLQK